MAGFQAWPLTAHWRPVWHSALHIRRCLPLAHSCKLRGAGCWNTADTCQGEEGWAREGQLSKPRVLATPSPAAKAVPSPPPGCQPRPCLNTHNLPAEKENGNCQNHRRTIKPRESNTISCETCLQFLLQEEAKVPPSRFHPVCKPPLITGSKNQLSGLQPTRFVLFFYEIG